MNRLGRRTGRMRYEGDLSPGEGPTADFYLLPLRYLSAYVGLDSRLLWRHLWSAGITLVKTGRDQTHGRSASTENGQVEDRTGQ